MMAAVYLLNPQQFVDGNPDHLRPGSTLKMPGVEVARTLLRRASVDAKGEAPMPEGRLLAREAAWPAGRKCSAT